MKPLPEVALDCDVLSRMLCDALPAQILLAAIELDVFMHLTEAGTSESLAERIGTHPRNTRVLLDALVANDLLTKRDGRYRNTALADAYLVRDRPTFIGDVLIDDWRWIQPVMEEVTQFVRHGPSAVDWPRPPTSELKEVEIRANGQRAGPAQRAAAMVSRLPEFPRMNRMLDLGAGAGLIGLAIVAAHPTMTGVILDRPEIVAVAQRFIREYELQDRVTTIGGDYYTDDIGAGYDLVWTSYAIDRDRVDQAIGRIFAALNPAGVHINVSEGLTDERTRPARMVNMMLAHTLGGSDAALDEGEIAQAMFRAGFRSVHTRSMCGYLHSPAVVDVARK